MANTDISASENINVITPKILIKYNCQDWQKNTSLTKFSVGKAMKKRYSQTTTNGI